jgi:3-deoxy-7-phosphoheptulonate synthase
MVVVMAQEAAPQDVDAVVELVRGAGGEAFVSRGVSRTIVGLVGHIEQFHMNGAIVIRLRVDVVLST